MIMGYLMNLMTMIFLHIIADFNLQGILAKLKSKKFWERNYPDKKYERDYIIAMFIHSFSWTFIIMIPIFFMNNFTMTYLTFSLFLINMIVHATIDDAKANELKISLAQDQLFHLLQIIITLTVCYIFN